MNRGSFGRTVSFLALALVALGLSIGFAAFSNTLRISTKANVKPDEGTFNVDFLNENGYEDVIVPEVLGGASATDAVISNVGDPTVEEINATFTAPGQKVVYEFFVSNSGEYDAYLNAITFANVPNSSMNKVCTGEFGTTQGLLDAACDDITIEVSVDNVVANSTVANIDDALLETATRKKVIVTLEYAAGGDRADGDFSVAFGDVSLLFSTVD